MTLEGWREFCAWACAARIVLPTALPPLLCVCPNARRFFNTNNLWVDLEQLQKAMAEAGGALKLPLIKNKKVRARPTRSAAPDAARAPRSPGGTGLAPGRRHTRRI